MAHREQRRRPLIWVYAIAKNEAQHVERFMKSIRDADGVLVLDTGSTDGTPEQLEQQGAMVMCSSISPWRFDVARNTALALVPAHVDICLMMDIDEVMEEGWRAKIEEAWSLGITHKLSYTLIASHTPDGGDGTVVVRANCHARHGYTWQCPIHEALVWRGEGHEHVKAVPSLRVHHWPDTSKSRSDYLPLLELAFAEAPHDARRLHYLGREYWYAGRAERARAALLAHIKSENAHYAERAESMRILAKLCDEPEKTAWLMRACAEDPGRRDQWVDLAEARRVAQDYAGGVAAATRALAITDPFSYITYPEAWGSRPHDELAVSAYYLGLLDVAIRQAENALGYEPENPRLIENLRLMQGGMPCASQ